MKYIKLGLLLLSLLLVGCQAQQTYDIYNTWVCENKKGPIFVIQENGHCFQYNKQINRKINYFSGKRVNIKKGEDVVSLVHQTKPDMTFKDIDHLYSIQFYFDTYIDEKGKDNSNLITEKDVWWYLFQIVGNGRAEVLNMNTGETFYMEVK